MTIRKLIEQFKEYDLPSESGDKERLQYELVIEDGQKIPKVCGVIDIQAEIESYAESVDIYNILERFGAGDVTALNRAKTFFADVSELPVKMQDLLALNQQGENIFNALSGDVREIFDNDYLKFLANPEKLEEYMKTITHPVEKAVDNAKVNNETED